eukprot:TRINITY_DN60213_c0_g1_i1.p1 TRINITY_DN60213_c0_g1~~TRINITY_DN60213_c0_g1_i1.p1  ORF type:complete len:147 (-),score=26.49 TRINITY_DN60213_c0_g1_i1:72-512(-)
MIPAIFVLVIATFFSGCASDPNVEYAVLVAVGPQGVESFSMPTSGTEVIQLGDKMVNVTSHFGWKKVAITNVDRVVTNDEMGSLVVRPMTKRDADYVQKREKEMTQGLQEGEHKIEDEFQQSFTQNTPNGKMSNMGQMDGSFLSED